MSKQLFPLLLLMLARIAASSQEIETTRIYEVRSNIPAYPCDVLGEKLYDENTYRVPPYRARFAFIRFTKNNEALVRFLTWKVGSSNFEKFNKPVAIEKIKSANIKNNNTEDRDSIDKYFLISRADLDSNCIKYYSAGRSSIRFTMGLVTMPMKLRLGSNFNFHGNLSLGTTAGIKKRISNYNANYINFLLGASISTVDLDSFSTGGKVGGQPITNMAVFSPSVGIVFEFGKAQAGIFYGWDLLNKSSQEKYTWKYHKKPWISVGFGFSIFNIDSKSSAKGEPVQAATGSDE